MTEDDIHFRIAAARRMLFRAGIDSQVGGHVSVRAGAEDAFYITPYQYFDETLPEHVLKVGFDLQVREPGSLPASPGINFHSDIYRARADVNCVIHTHARNAALVSALPGGFVPYHIYGSMFFEDVASFTDDPGATPDVEGALMAIQLGAARVMLLRHHGVLHVGPSLEETTADVMNFDLTAEYQLAAIPVNADPLPPDTARTYKALYEKVGFRRQVWDANYRRLRKSDPDLFAVATC